ncbi:MAG: energy transducer TonB [Saprospiraceae bacterium]
MMYKIKKRNGWKYLFASFVFILLMFYSCSKNQDDNKSIQDQIYQVVEEMPRFPGCENEATKEDKEMCSQQKLMEYIYSNLKYPEEAIRDSIDGKVLIQFIVTKDGNITDVKILDDPGNGLGKAAEQTIESMNKMSEKWVPGKHDGKNVNVSFVLPVIFKLQD